MQCSPKSLSPLRLTYLLKPCTVTCPGHNDRLFKSRREQGCISKTFYWPRYCTGSLDGERKRLSLSWLEVVKDFSFFFFFTSAPEHLSPYGKRRPSFDETFSLCLKQRNYARISNRCFSACLVWLWHALNSGENSGQEKLPYWLWITVHVYRRGWLVGGIQSWFFWSSTTVFCFEDIGQVLNSEDWKARGAVLSLFRKVSEGLWAALLWKYLWGCSTRRNIICGAYMVLELEDTL